MNRQRRCALLAPLLASAVALPPAVAAQAAPAEPAAVQVPAAPACQLKPTANAQNRVDVVLTGFAANQRVTINRAGGRPADTRVDAQGNLTAKNLRDGTYSIRAQGRGGGSTVPCADTPAPVKVDIADADVVATKPDTPTVPCNQTTAVTFAGTLKGTGTGDVKVKWVGSTGKQSQPTVKFTGPSTPVPEFTITAPARANPAADAPTVTAQLTVPQQGSETGVSSEVFRVTLRCAAGT
ncbi:hypothetical protein ACYTFC_17765 [Streptomyces globosus]